MSTENDTTDDDAQIENTIDSRDDIPDRDELVTLRRDQGLTNDDIADNHVTEFSSRQIGIFCSMYGIDKGWKDAEYLQEQIDSGVTPEGLAEQWPVSQSTVRKWMGRFDIDENPIPGAYENAVEALDELANALEEEGNQDEAGEIDGFATDLSERLEDYRL